MLQRRQRSQTGTRPIAWFCGTYYCSVVSFIFLLASVSFHVSVSLRNRDSHMCAEGLGAFIHPVTPFPQEATMEVRNDPPHSR